MRSRNVMRDGGFGDLLQRLASVDDRFAFPASTTSLSSERSLAERWVSYHRPRCISRLARGPACTPLLASKVVSLSKSNGADKECG